MLNDKYRMNLMGELKSILLATDGSQYSEGAIKEAINFARACRTRLTVLRVIEYNPEFDAIGDKYADAIETSAGKHFEDIRTLAAEENVECDIMLRRSVQAYESVIEEAKKLKADIIIMGRRGKTGLTKLVLGSQTAKTIAYAPCKVLVVPKDSEIKGEYIMFATDGSKFSEAAEKEAINMAASCPFVKQLVAVSVVQSKEQINNAEKILEKVKQNAQSRSVNIETLALVGQPYKAIVNASLESSSDLIIVGSHGRTGLQKLLMGSVAERVAALAMSAVLIVKI
ncbi:UspA domain-containing protein [Candidatus Magnetoovum chiemensis]|nr:UspA domain-containing protein [Candidatus Magnetoovum chiemensis]